MKIFFIYLFCFINFISISFGLENKIEVKVDNEIITSLDINNEKKYLLALNKNFINIDNSKAIDIAKKSIIREKIKKIEILRNFADLKINEDVLNNILKSIYTNIGIANLNDFKLYLKSQNVDFNLVKKK